MPLETLARPLPLPCGVVLPNRIAKSAMSEALGDPRTLGPTDRLVRLYQRLGRGGAGLLITGNVMVERRGMGEPGNVVIEDDAHSVMLRRWAQAAQAHGSRIWVQLNHAGRQAVKAVVPAPVAPSAVSMKGMGAAFATPRALTPAEIEQVIARYAAAARVVRDAGFDGVQIHGAHGYLVSQFLSPLTNLRDDAWGGDPQRRMRFVIELFRKIRAAVGPAFPVGVKLNSADFQRGGFSAEDAILVAKALEAEGVDLLEISGGSYEAPAMMRTGEMLKPGQESTRSREAFFLEYAKQIRAATHVPLMLTGGLRTAAVMAEVIESGAVDVVGIARPMAFDPDLPGRLIRGEVAAAAPVKIRSHIRRLDGLMQIYWYQAQLHAMASGAEPNVNLGVGGTLLHVFKQTVTARPRPQAAAPGATVHAQG